MPRITLAAPGTGKTHWANTHANWRDMDDWAAERGLHDESWHLRDRTEAEQQAHYMAIDAALQEYRATPGGANLVGALFWDFRPDAIVCIDPATHKQYVEQRDDLEWESVDKIVQILHIMAKEKNVPLYDSFDSAAAPRQRRWWRRRWLRL
jgi:hypothetical protein